MWSQFWKVSPHIGYDLMLKNVRAIEARFKLRRKESEFFGGFLNEKNCKRKFLIVKFDKEEKIGFRIWGKYWVIKIKIGLLFQIVFD